MHYIDIKRALLNTAVFMVILGLAACAGMGGKPQWVDGTSEKYPDAEFMTAGGTGDDREKAKSRALGNLAKIFEVQIDESSYDESRAWTKTENGERQQGHGQLAVRYLDAYTSKLLEGAVVAETWFDDSVGVYHALAVLARAPLSQRLTSDIQKNDRYSQSAVSDAQATNDPFTAARHLFRARSAQVHREGLQRDLRIVDPKGIGVRPLWTVKQLDGDIDRQLKRMKVSAKVLHDPVGDLAQYLQAGITNAGMLHAETDAAYRLEGHLDIKDPTQADGWYWYRGSLEISLRRNADDTRMLVGERWPLKVAGATREQAEVRLRDQLQQRLSLELKTALLGVRDKPTGAD
jgi:hypothetical protein